MNTIETWHQLVHTQNAAGLATLLADDAVFYSPIVHTPQVGKPIVQLYLTAASQVFFNPSIRRWARCCKPNRVEAGPGAQKLCRR